MKIKNFTAFVCTLFVAQLSFGQITFEHSYNNSVGSISKNYSDFTTIKYSIDDPDNGTFTIYNLDHSVYKVIKPKVPDGTSLYNFSSLCTNVINTDPLVELCYTLKYKDANNKEVHDTYLINENEELIKKFENIKNLFPMTTDDGMKLVASTYELVGSRNEYKSDIYSLPTTPGNIPSLQSETKSLPYPNPAKQTITIPYQLSGQWGTISIYNASGQFVEQKNVDKNFSNLLLDVSGYAKGMYYYKVDKQKGEFMVN